MTSYRIICNIENPLEGKPDDLYIQKPKSSLRIIFLTQTSLFLNSLPLKDLKIFY